MSDAVRILPQEAREKVRSGQAVLVCAYADDAKFARYHLEGAIPLSAFQATVGELAKDLEIIFYCN